MEWRAEDTLRLLRLMVCLISGVRPREEAVWGEFEVAEVVQTPYLVLQN